PTTLRFPHDVHMNPKGIESRTRVEVLECASCHEAADTETGFKAVEMEAHCQSCHSLASEPALPEREVPHGASGPVLDTIVEFYSFLKQNPQMQADIARVRDTYLARPGASNKPRASVKANALVQAEAAAQDLFENRACAVCHQVSISDQPVTAQTSGSQLTQYTVADVAPTHPWMPMARFDHKAHEFDSCESCHKATTSDQAEDVLMPSLEGCQTCHSGSAGSLNKVESNCGVCHGYHIHDSNPPSGVPGQLSEETVAIRD
ncbi:MAG: cytochrome c3 family protein, partial [Limnobacter sp.]|nr:cytochrome c3 family protein [Limnobacter sp.]